MNKKIKIKMRERSNLIRRIHLCEEYNTKVINHSENGMFKGRELEDWTNHYNNQIRLYEKKVKEIDDEIRSRQSMDKFIGYSFIFLIFLSFGGFMFAGFKGGITGMVVTTVDVTVLNIAPNLTTVLMNSSLGSNYSNENLDCYVNITDANLDSVYVNYNWYKNGSIELSGIGSALTQGIFGLGITLGHGNITKSDNWTCEITPYDGTETGTPILNSTSVLIRNSQINVTKLEITDNGLDYSRMSLTPVQGSRANAAIRARIYDIDGDTEQIITAYICNLDHYSDCNETDYSYAKNLSYISEDADDYHYFGYNGSLDMPWFYESNGTWRLYVKAVDDEFSDSNMTDFTFAELNALGILNYSNSSINSINLGNNSVEPGSWSISSENYTLKNYGNANLRIEINASDMVGAYDTWNLNGSDFAIDDDNSLEEDIGNIDLIYINNTPKEFGYGGGLLKCNSSLCDDENATLTTYYYIFPPQGLKAGVYNTTILFTVSKR
jgi:hypothetical protein